MHFKVMKNKFAHDWSERKDIPETPGIPATHEFQSQRSQVVIMQLDEALK